MTRYIIASQKNDAPAPCQAGRLHIQSANVFTHPGEGTMRMDLKDILKRQSKGGLFAVEVRQTNDTEQVEWHEAIITLCACGELGQYVVNPSVEVIQNLNTWAKGD